MSRREVPAVILFDGVCNLCNASVRFVLAHDRSDYFRFASLQSATGRDLARKHGLPADLSTFYLIKDGSVCERSDAWRSSARRGLSSRRSVPSREACATSSTTSSGATGTAGSGSRRVARSRIRP